jgi:desulfoferrodoxin (superoxide reductase-like protein)
MKHFLITLASLLILSSAAFANKTSVEIDAPKEAKKGEEITITIHVKHNGNNFLHHTNWVKLWANGELLKEWSYKKDRPDSENFKLTYKVTLKENLALEAEGHCNTHGSKNIAKHTVTLIE